MRRSPFRQIGDPGKVPLLFSGSSSGFFIIGRKTGVFGLLAVRTGFEIQVESDDYWLFSGTLSDLHDGGYLFPGG